MGKLRGCDRFWEVEGVRSLFGSWRGAIAFGKLRGCDRFLEVGGVRRFWGVRECDSEALRRNRCLGI
ncbi:MAG: hypothetical protein HEQ29_15230 [Dolichospermum sp. LBC05a]|nr:hypothetical protein [Dolichospermum sp. OL01]MCO5798057.1 hypothetical protein [Dolichospermum sp. OL03]QSV59533.1 MAG: hypothetical protein HEQ29_15230 [Dolichospermum sp. LBC05a]